jgi:hypothetical protein
MHGSLKTSFQDKLIKRRRITLLKAETGIHPAEHFYISVTDKYTL